MTATAQPRWYLVQTRPRQEARAEENLQRQAFECYRPLIERGQGSSEPLFPGYLFIRLDHLQDNWYPIRSTRGVARIVAFGGQPTPVQDALIGELRERVERVVETLVVEDRPGARDALLGAVEPSGALDRAGRVRRLDAMFDDGNEDPWGVEDSFYERRKRALTLAAPTRDRLGRVLEIGCATGVLTRELAPRSDAVVAVDVSAVGVVTVVLPWLDKALAEKRKIMGFGHRVYKNFDPRAKVMKQTCDEVLQELGINDPQLELAMKLEEIARHDPYFVERNLYPNVDFYSGIILKAIGIPTSMFTVIFALARTVGWISHWKEMLSSPYKIGRPRQLYTGYESRDIAKLEDRK